MAGHLRRWFGVASYSGQVDMSGRTVIVTGANSGIGEATVVELAKRNARVILACRNLKKAEEATKRIREYTSKGELIVKQLDLASFASIRKFSKDIVDTESNLNILINNAGILGGPFTKTEDGLESQMGVNHFGHFLLTNLLLEKLKEGTPSRIINLSSGMERFGKIEFDNLNSEKSYGKMMAYCNSKLANCLFSRELCKRLTGTGVDVHCIRPGLVRTNVFNSISIPSFIRFMATPLTALVMKTSEEGCQTVLYCAAEPNLQGVSGKYYFECKEKDWSQHCLDDETASKLWDVSGKMTELA